LWLFNRRFKGASVSVEPRSADVSYAFDLDVPLADGTCSLASLELLSSLPRRGFFAGLTETGAGEAAAVVGDFAPSAAVLDADALELEVEESIAADLSFAALEGVEAGAGCVAGLPNIDKRDTCVLFDILLTQIKYKK
jgi:hypothetical protein